MAIPDYLGEIGDEEKQQDLNDSLGELSALVDRYEKACENVVMKKTELAQAEQVKLQIGGTDIPTLMLSKGISRIRLADGREVNIKDDLSVTITNDALFHKFLSDRGESDLVKLKFQFDRMTNGMQVALYKFLTTGEYKYEADKSVHPQTLKKYFRLLLGLEGKTGTSENGKLIASFAKIFPYYVTKVDKKKDA